jgi:hypothetical protein
MYSCLPQKPGKGSFLGDTGIGFHFFWQHEEYWESQGEEGKKDK